MDRINIVLAAIDCSEASRAALLQANRIAEWRKSELHVVHVVDEQSICDLAVWWQTSNAEARDQCLGLAKHHVEAFIAKTLPDAQVKLHLLAGCPIDEIRSLATTLSADLIVGGVSGGFVENGTGMLATRLVRKLSSKIMLVQPEATTGFQEVLACIDFSKTSRKVVEQARRISNMQPTRIHFLHTYRRPWETLPGLQAPRVPELEIKELEDRLRTQVEVFTAASSFANAAIHIQAANGHSDVIAAFAKKHAIDLILIGSKGQTDLNYVAVGSTAERLMRDLSCSLLVIKQGQENIPENQLPSVPLPKLAAA